MSDKEGLHEIHMENVFQWVEQYNMRLNLEKFAFEVGAYKFLDF